jgi:hypothetical protein
MTRRHTFFIGRPLPSRQCEYGSVCLAFRSYDGGRSLMIVDATRRSHSEPSCR